MFSRLGKEARLYLLRADTIQRLLNLHYIENSPWRDEFIQAPRLNYAITEMPEMGLPTGSDSDIENQQNLISMKEKQRKMKLMSNNPPYMYLCETVSNLIRCMRPDLPQEGSGTTKTPYTLDDFGLELSRNNLVLFTPDVHYILKLFRTAHKSRAAVALAKAYIHYSYHSPQRVEILSDIVRAGLEQSEY